MSKFGVYTYYNQPRILLWMGEATSPRDACAAALSDLWMDAPVIEQVSPDIEVDWDELAEPLQYLTVLAIDELNPSIDFELLDALGPSVDEEQWLGVFYATISEVTKRTVRYRGTSWLADALRGSVDRRDRRPRLVEL